MSRALFIKKGIVTSLILFLFLVALYISFFLSSYIWIYIKSKLCTGFLGEYLYCYFKPILFTKADMLYYMLPVFVVLITICFFAFKEIYYDSMKLIEKKED